MLQTDSPLEPMTMYLNGFHVAKEDASHQMEAHHFCRQVNEDFAQCAIFDGNTSKANLVGIEYIISEALFSSLPEAERSLWHPHNYEILSGQLIAPNIPESTEMSLMKSKINSYGKTWRLWDTASPGKSGDTLPLGKPVLDWSLNNDGEILPGLVEKRDGLFGVSTNEKRQARKPLRAFAKPQTGTDALNKTLTHH